MIKSMTGYGHASHDDGQLQITVEVKSLNSKFMDINLRTPKGFSEKELEIRNLITEKLERGKVAVSIDYQRYGEVEIKQSYNEELFLSYYQNLKKLADRVYAPHEQLFSFALNAPDVIQNKLSESATEDDWEKLKTVVVAALDKCETYRLNEGKALLGKLNEYAVSIEQSLSEIEQLDAGRVQRVRDRIKGNIVSFFGEEGYDVNRLEQEIIFYIEKLDINEEKVRLKTHLDYYKQILNDKQSNGKKLGFLAQEIGREINTIGSKANDATIQKHVVNMKEELEKIKEQLNNIL